MILGSNHTEEVKEEHREFMKNWHKNNPHPKGMLGKNHNKETKKKIGKASEGRGAGRILSDKTKKKISETRKKFKLAVGKNNPNYKPKVEKICLYCGMIFYVISYRSDKAKYHNLECRNLADREKDPWNKGLISADAIANHRIRCTAEYSEWREAVLLRDNFVCQRCFKKKKDLEAHHIKTFYEYPDLRFDVSNGLSLCNICHLLERNQSDN